MDIHIQLAGVQLGPYNEKQVREYISDGLLSMADKARIEGTLEWIPVSELVAKLPPPPQPAPPPDPNAVFVDAEPLAAPSPARAPAADSGYVSLVEPSSGVLGNPPAAAETDISTAKPKPLAPPTLSSGGLIKTKPLGPLAPTAPVGKAKGIAASKSVSTTAPLAQATKKMSRTALAQAFQNKTEPLGSRLTSPVPAPKAPPSAPPLTDVPAVSATAPETTGPMAGGVTEPTTPPPNAKKGGGLPALLKSLSAKTVPMRGAAPDAPAAPEPLRAPPATPPGRTTMPVTTPMPTRAIMNPAANRANRAASPPPAAPPAPPEEKATELLPVSKKAVELRAKAAQRAAEREAAEAPLPGAIEPAPASKASRMTKSLFGGKVPPQPKPPEPAPAPEASPEAESDEPTPPRAKRRLPLVPLVLVLFGITAIAGAYYVWSPYHASSSLRDAMAAGSASDLQNLVDFDSLRASLKQQAQSLAGSSSAPASADALGIVGQSIDTYVTPDNVAYLVTKPRQDDQRFSGDVISPDVAANLVTAFVNQPLRGQGWATPTDFMLQTDVANLHLTLHGGHWLLTSIDVKPDQPVPAEAAGAPLGLVPVVETYLARGRQAQSTDGAVKYLTKALALAPQSTVASDARGNAHLDNHDADAAIKDFTQSVTIDPGDASAYNGRGLARMAKLDFDHAIGDFTQALKIDPSMALAYDNRGRAKSASNDLDGAIQDFTQAIGIDPTLASAFSDRGIARQAHGNLDGAIKDYTDALTLTPNAARTYLNRGLARLSQNNLPGAIVDFDHAIGLDPTIADAWFQRGNARSARHDTAGAIADFTKTLALDPKNALAYCSRGVAREDKGDLAGALADYTQALTLDPKIAVAYFRRALIEVRQDNPDGAIADTSQSIDLDPQTPQAYYYRGFAKLLRGNLDGAASDFQLFCDAAPHDRFADNARLYLWLVAKQQVNHPDPDQDLSDALESSWNNTADDFTSKTAAFLLGRVTESDYLTAAASSAAAVDASQHCQAYYFAGMKRLLMGDKGTAGDYFQRCLATGKKDFCEYILAQAELQQLAAAPPPPAPAPVAPAAPVLAAPSAVPIPVPTVPPTAAPAVPAMPAQ